MNNNQQERILRLLRDRVNTWVPLPEILKLGCAQYNTRIKELRGKGYKIDNKTEHVGRERKSWFMLVDSTRLF